MGENCVVQKFPVAILIRLNSTEQEYKSFRLDSNEVTFGRSLENKCVIQNVRLSRKHAIFRMINGKWFIESVGLNSVWLNNIIMKKNHQKPLHYMDTINFSGDDKFLYAFVDLTVVSSEATASQVIQQPMVAANQKRNEAFFKKINKHLNQFLKYRKRQYCFQ
jgi:pSer/pThr/pTyr-binding forkhead associated (FHA) protein